MIYLDNAATTFPKPPGVAEAVSRALTGTPVAYGRGTSRAMQDVRRTVDRCRQQIADLISAPDFRSILFTSSGTDSLNLAIRGLLRTGDHVVTSTIEHNAVARTLSYLESEHGVEVTRVRPDASGVLDADEVGDAVRSETRLVVCLHVSNVTGAVQPIEAIGRRVADSDAAFLVDAAQSLGSHPIDVAESHMDMLAAPGHKGLLGPLGTGVLYLHPKVAPRVTPLRFGGTGSNSERDAMPDDLPDRFEAGNHNVPGLLGLAASVEHVRTRTVEGIAAHERNCLVRLLDGFRERDAFTIHGSSSTEDRAPIVSVTHAELPPEILAGALESAAGIIVRAGLHCAPGAHRELGTLDAGGTVRFSCGPFTTEAEIDAVLEALDAVTL